MFIGLLLIFTSIAVTWGAVITVATAISWRGFWWAMAFGLVGMLVLALRDPGPVSHGVPSAQFMTQVFLAAFAAGTFGGACVGFPIQLLLRMRRERS